MPSATSERQGDPKFFDTLRGSILSSIPALSALIFVIVAVKVFRASGMETTTTVAIVSSADVIALLKGVTLTMLPGFLAAVTAASMWWWADSFPHRSDAGFVTRSGAPLAEAEAARWSLVSAQAAFCWAMVIMAFFTISWPVFLALFLPVALATFELLRQCRTKRYNHTITMRLRRDLKGIGGTAAAVAIGILTLAPSVWLPLRIISVSPGHSVTANGHQMPQQFAAYVLSSDEKGASLLLAQPRAVVTVGPKDISPEQPLCVTPEAPTRAFYLRASQLLHLDSDNHSPYGRCPDLDYQTIFGN